MKWRKSDSPPAEDRFEEWFNRKRQESILGGAARSSARAVPGRFVSSRSRSEIQDHQSLRSPRGSCGLMSSLHEEAAGSTEGESHIRSPNGAYCHHCLLPATCCGGRMDFRSQIAGVSAGAKRCGSFQNSGLVKRWLLSGRSTCPAAICFLAAALVKVTIVLPRYSTPGQYLVAVTRDQSGMILWPTA